MIGPYDMGNDVFKLWGAFNKHRMNRKAWPASAGLPWVLVVWDQAVDTGCDSLGAPSPRIPSSMYMLAQDL